MALQIINAGPPPEELATELRDRILTALPGAEVEVEPRTPGHFDLRVTSQVFEGLGRVAQQQRVYRAIADLMTGPDAPVHAIDRMECRLP